LIFFREIYIFQGLTKNMPQYGATIPSGRHAFGFHDHPKIYWPLHEDIEIEEVLIRNGMKFNHDKKIWEIIKNEEEEIK